MGNIRRFFDEEKFALIRFIKIRGRREVWLPFFFMLSFLFFNSQLALASAGILFGRITDEKKGGLAGVHVVLENENGSSRITTTSSPTGSFRLTGIPPGRVALFLEIDGNKLRFEDLVTFDPERVLYLEISVTSQPGGKVRIHLKEQADLTERSTRTTIDSLQLDSLPSAENVWSVIENQDFSATTNRVDVGGMWADEPALWSSRGGVSWTQTSYLLNGMDVTAPYWRGKPLFYPDISSLGFTQLANARLPVSWLSPGGGLNLLPKEGGSQTRFQLATSWSGSWMKASNISPRLEAEGLLESHRLNSFWKMSGQASGALMRGRLLFFASLYDLRLDRDLAEFDSPDKASVTSASINITHPTEKGSLTFFWTGQLVRQPSFGAGRNVPFSATLDRKQVFNVLQIIWKMRFKPWHSFELGASFSRGNLDDRFQSGEAKPHGQEIFTGLPSGLAASAGRDDQSTQVLLGRGQLLVEKSGPSLHRLSYGFSLRRVSSASRRTSFGNLHLHFFNGQPLEVVFFDGAEDHKERALDFSLFAEETIFWQNLFSLSLGFHLCSTRGWMPALTEGGKIKWLSLSPRLSFSFPLTRKKSSWLKVSAARYFFSLPLFYLSYGHPGAAGGLVYAWEDRNRDGEFSAGEQGELRRREGPRFSLIDPGLKRPYVDEYAVSYSIFFGKNFYFSLAGFYRETRQLVETVNTGVPLTAYTPLQIYDPGDDTIPGTHDDLYLTVYNQKKETLGQDFYILTNAEDKKRVSRYRGLDLTVAKKFSHRYVFFFSFTATEAIGTTSPGNTEWENDDGIVGRLYDDPNASLSSRGRLRFDRAYTARLGLSFPLGKGLGVAVLAKYYDGQPFARKIIVEGMNQGPFYVQAFYRGQARYEFNMTVDLRLEKALTWAKSRARIIIDGFNIFNFALATAENEWTGPHFPRRFATEVQSPRHIRLGFIYEF